MVQALDCLSRTASRYGRRAKNVFESNREPIVNATQLFECLPFADAETEFLLKVRLEAMPEFDPEGWSHLIECLAGKHHHVELVEDDSGMRKVFGRTLDIGWVHIHSDSLDLGGIAAMLDQRLGKGPEGPLNCVPLPL
jgi:hypothetical protein